MQGELVKLQMKKRKITVKVPPGVDSGVRLRLSGEGEPGPLGGPSGDLYVVLHAKESDRFTRDANVTLSLSWPDGATGMKIATDGGFKGATTVPIAPTATVQLTGDDNTLLPHVVYVRFSGAGIDARETYTDDIILDTTPPVIEKVSAERVGAKAVRVSTRVRDAVSGPQRLQVARSVSAQGTTVAYAPAVRAAVKGRKVAVRVADGAGNWSKWKTVATKAG